MSRRISHADSQLAPYTQVLSSRDLLRIDSRAIGKKFGAT